MFPISQSQLHPHLLSPRPPFLSLHLFTLPFLPQAPPLSSPLPSNSNTASSPPPNSTDLTPSNHSDSSTQLNKHMRRTSPPAPHSPSPPPSSDHQSDHPTQEAIQPADLPGFQGRNTQPHPDKARQVASEASHLQDKFVSVLTNTKILFSENESESDKFCNRVHITLTTLPLSGNFKHTQFLRQAKESIENAKSIKEIFSILEDHWNWSNYTLLQRLITKFGNDPLKEEMKKYVKELHHFEKTTSIQIFSYVDEGWKCPPYLTEAVLTFKMDETNLTLYDVRQIEEDIANLAVLKRYAVYRKSVHCSAVVLTLAFPRDGLELFAPALSPEFLAKHQITSVVIDGLPLEKYTQEYVKVKRSIKK